MGSSKSTTEQSIPDWQKKFLTGTVQPLAHSVARTPAQSYGGRFAPRGLSALSRQAASVYGDVAGMTPEAFAAQTQANFNPFQQQVIDTSLAQMDRSAGKARTGLQAGLIGSGAFGTRGEVARGEFEAGVQGQRDALIAQMQQQGYGQAQGVTQQQIVNRMAGAGGLGGLGGMQTALQGQQMAGEYGDFLRMQEDPQRRLASVMGFGGGNYGGTATERYSPGLFDYMSAGGALFSAF